MLTGLAFPPGEERDTLAALILVKHIRFSEESWRAANFPLQLLDWDGCQPVTLQSAFLFFTDFDFPMHPAAVTKVPSADILYSFFFSPQIPSYQPARDNISLQQQWHKARAWHHGTTPPSLCQCPTLPVPQAAAADPASTHLIMLSPPFVSGKWPCSWVIYKMPSCCCYTAHFHTFRCQGDLKCEQFSQHSPHGLQPGGYCLLWYAAALKHLIIWSITTLFSIPEIIQGGLHQSLTDFPSSPFTIQKTHLTTKETSYWIWNPGSRGGSPFLNHKDVLAQLLPFVTIDSSTLHRPKVGREVPAYSLHLIPTERPKGKQCSSPGKAVRWNLYAQSNSTWQTASLQGTFMYKERGW